MRITVVSFYMTLTDAGMTNPLVHNCPFKGRFLMGASETNGVQPCQARKENSQTSGLLCFLVARGGLEPPTQGFSSILR